jgi:quercetin dioxygenase-like cupin family protein
LYLISSLIELAVKKSNSVCCGAANKFHKPSRLGNLIMNTVNKTFQTLALTAAILSATTMASTAVTASSTALQESTSKLLTANFESRKVVKIEAGDFHFVAGQVAPVHTHAAPAVGYVARGEILYQVEGEKPRLLREGEAFYEPAGPRILRFDNASATEEAIFIDFNLQQQGEPFIVFEKELTEHIDRRTLPTVNLDGLSVDQVDMYVSELEPSGRKQLKTQEPMLGYVAEGIVELNIEGEAKQQIVAGGSFSLPADKSKVSIVNASSEVPAKVISFYLR